MPTFDELYKYHSFSKAPAASGLTTGQSVNKAGHTITAKDVWAFDVPYMFSVNTLSDLTSKKPKLNDLAWAGADEKYYQYNGTSWDDITDTISDTILKNADGKEVLRFHTGKLTVLDNDNNAGVTSNGQAYRFFVGDKPVQRWVAATDCIDETGFPSLGYNIIVVKNGNSTLLDGTDFFADYYGATIFFDTTDFTQAELDDLSAAEFNIACFEYVGKYVSEELGGNLVDNRGLNTTENDLWGHNVTKTNEFTRIGHDLVSASTLPEEWKNTVASISDNKAYDAEGQFVSFVETDMLADGTNMFGSTLTSFSGNLENLVIADRMFQGSSITSIDTELTKLSDATNMFKASNIKSFNIEMPSVVKTVSMFEDCANLTTCTSNMSYVRSATNMFRNSGIDTFAGALPYLYVGTGMFKNTNLRTINTAFSSLITGVGMFENTSLSLQSLQFISQSIPKINSLTLDENEDECYVFANGHSFYTSKHMWDGNTQSIEIDTEAVDISGNDIGEITITWKNRDLLNYRERLIAIREYFKWMQLKGWTVVSNINDSLIQANGDSGKVWGRLYEVPENEATHTTADGKKVVIATASNVYTGLSTWEKEDPFSWAQYDSVEDLITILQLTVLA